ncbi:MAG: calcium/sodium antiporter [Candidatus Woesearchaeota archaeon]|jgi:cation:H+ antiporter|nr:calcium/sodium antiporter [Candidatus Woesearchaeota archaeon]
MADPLTWIVVFLVSIIVLIKASDYFTDSAEKIGLFFKIPPFIIGVTIVAIGTSLPELISSIIAVMKGSPGIVAGNVVGSNIANIFFVLGIAAIISKKVIKIEFELIHVDLPMLIGSAFLLTLTFLDGVFTFGEGLLSIAGIILYLIYTSTTKREHRDFEISDKVKKEEKVLEEKKLNWTTILILIASSIFIFIGAKYTVESVIELSQIFSIGAEVIAASAVALGTSLPELMVTVSAARKGQTEMALGNVLGSNVFNSFAVMGIAVLFGDITIPSSILTFALPVMVIATLLYFFITLGKEITKWEGWLLIIFYIFFIGKLFNLF